MVKVSLSYRFSRVHIAIQGGSLIKVGLLYMVAWEQGYTRFIVLISCYKVSINN